MPGTVIHFSKASREALKKRGEEAEAALTSEQREERERRCGQNWRARQRRLCRRR
jgi:hypothetical protein